MRARAAAGTLFAAFLLAGAAPFLPAQELSVSAGAGGFRPAAGLYRDIYGSAAAWGVSAWLTLRNHLGFAAGLDTLADDGLAVGPGAPAGYPLTFRRITIPVIAYYELGFGRLAVRLGAGGGLHMFRERWRTVDLSYGGREISTRVTMAVSLRIFKGLSLFGSAVYEPIRAGESSPNWDRVRIGGFQVLGGLAFRVF